MAYKPPSAIKRLDSRAVGSDAADAAELCPIDA
jgi:hypothetical protein